MIFEVFGIRLVDAFFKVVEAFLALCLLSMVVMVFGNVVLRYGFNSGITISEELSRFVFMWLTFVGAVVAMREGSHLGVDTLVSRLSRAGKKICLVISEVLMLFCCGVFFWGTWLQHEINATNVAPVTGMNMIWVYGIGYVTSVGIAVLIVHKLWRLATGQITDDELVEIKESEEEAIVLAAEAGAASARKDKQQ
jgi:TRAP-type C4-dicarboxylate transport system permease small subunit